VAEFLQGTASKANEQRPRPSWLAPALAVSLIAHAGLAAILWAGQSPQPKAGAVVGVEIVSAAGAENSSSTQSGASPARGAVAPAKPATVPAPSTPPPPDAPRAAREAPRAALPPRDAPPLPAPEHVAAPTRDDAALRRPAPSEAAPTPSAAEAPKPSPPEIAKPQVDEIALRPPARAARETAPSVAAPAPPSPPRALTAPRVKDIALRRPARIPPPPAKAPRLAAAAASRGTERAQARPQTASVPIVAADAAPGAGPENGTTPPRYGFGSAANPIPRYPHLARENGWEGVVMLMVQVGARGEALSVSIARSSGHGLLDVSAVDAVRRWRFEPARRAGIPVAGTATVPIRFRLEE
jgi:protein TonB